MESRRERAQEAGDDTGEENERDQPRAKAGVQRVGRNLAWQEGDERADRGWAERNADSAAGEREKEAIGQELAPDAAAGGAEGQAGADLRPARRAAREEEAGYIEAVRAGLR